MTSSGAHYNPTLLLTPPDPTLCFETFVPCKSNSFPLEMARVISENGGTRSAYCPLYLYSSIGMGKTHLLSAISNDTHLSSLLVNTADLDVEFEQAERMQCRAELRRFLVEHDILLVDDIQLCEGNEKLQREIFAVFNQLTRSGRAVVISSDVPPTRLSGVEERLLSRLGSGVIIGLQMADRFEKIALLKKFASKEELPEEVTDFLADQTFESIRDLKAITLRILAESRRSGDTANIDIARSVLTMTTETVPNRELFSQLQTGTSTSNGIPDENIINRYKEMLSCAETEEEQALALQIAISTRLRQLKSSGSDPKLIQELRNKLELIREGKFYEALKMDSLRDNGTNQK